MIKTEGLLKKFQDVVAVDRLDLEVPAGEIFGFLGPNGAGKTTTVKLLTGLLKPTAGRSWIGGIDVQRDPRGAKKIMGLVPDQPYVYPHLTGKEFLRFVGDLYDVLAGGEDSADGVMKSRFESAKQMYTYRFLPVLQEAAHDMRAALVA